MEVEGVCAPLLTELAMRCTKNVCVTPKVRHKEWLRGRSTTCATQLYDRKREGRRGTAGVATLGYGNRACLAACQTNAAAEALRLRPHECTAITWQLRRGILPCNTTNGLQKHQAVLRNQTPANNTCQTAEPSYTVVQNWLVQGNITIPANTKETTFLSTLAHGAGQMQEQPYNPPLWRPPTTHAPFTAKLPPRWWWSVFMKRNLRLTVVVVVTPRKVMDI